MLDLAKDIQMKQMQERLRSTIRNMHAVYVEFYDLFKKWHSNILE